MKKFLSAPARAIFLVAFTMLSLICFYRAVATRDSSRTGHGDATANATANVAPVPEPEDLDSYLSGVGPESVSPEDLAKVRAAARALRHSRFSHVRKFEPAEAPSDIAPYTSWTAPILPPIADVYHANVKNSGRVYAFGFDVSNGNVVYAAGAGGLLKTTNANNINPTWQFLSDNWESQAVSSIAVDPKAASHVYVSTGSDYEPYSVGLYRSTDSGSQWTLLTGNCPSCGATNVFEGTALRAVVVDPNSSTTGPSSTLYVAADHSGQWSGLWRSTDMGDHWERELARSYNGIWDMAIDSVTSTLYVGDNTGVYQKKTGGNWTLILAPNSNWTKFDQVRLAVVNSVPYVLSPTAGTSFVYKLFYSQTPNPNPPVNWIEVPTLLNGNPISPYKFAVDPSDINGNRILLGTADFFGTTNKGLSWAIIRQQPQGDLHVDFHALAYSPAQANHAYVGNDGGIWKSTQNGNANTWEPLNQNLPGSLLYGVALSNDDTMLAGTQDNGSVVRLPGGIWKTILSGDATRALIEPSNGGEYSYYAIFGGGPFRRFKKSTQFDTDISWPYGSEPCSFIPAFSLNPLVPQRLVAGCQHVARTWNGTVNTPVQWQPIGNPFITGNSTLTAVVEAPSDPNVIYAVEQYGKVWVTRNAGTNPSATPTVPPTWTPVFNPGGISNVTVDPANPNIAYLACDSGVYRTVDWGTNWFRSGVWGFIYRDIAIDPANSNHLFVASNMGVFKSTDAGGTWEDMSDGIPAGLVVNSLSLNPSTRRLAAATWGRGVYLLDVPTPTPCPSCTPFPAPTPSPTPTPTPTPPPTPTPTPFPVVSVTVALPIATVPTSTTNFTKPVTASTISSADGLVGFEAEFTFDSSIISFQAPPVSPAGLSANNWSVTGHVINSGPGTIKRLRLSGFSNDLTTPLSGGGTLFTLNMTRISSTPGANTLLDWTTPPSYFYFYDTKLQFPYSPSSAPTGSITVVGPSISVAGTVNYCTSPSLNPVPGVSMALVGSPSGSTLTDSSGNYTFASLTSGANYTVTPTKGALAPGSASINTVDMLAVQRHFLNLTPIPPGCRLTAADVNGDSTITTVDSIAIQRFFLGLTTGTVNVGKYRFTPTSRSYSAISGNLTGQNYDTLIFGDVSPSFAH